MDKHNRLKIQVDIEHTVAWWKSTTRIGDYVLEYNNPMEDIVSLTVWKTYRKDDLPFSEVVIPEVFLK